MQARTGPESLSYDEVYAGASPWRLMTPIDHPEPAHCLVSGTGLTHLGSAAHRQAMHGKDDADLTDSMRMFRAGLEGGRPAAGTVGAAPEWFFKGTGAVLRAPGEALDLPPFGHDGGEEAELAGVYLIDAEGRPRRIGMATANEFSDHALEKTNYLHLAASKLRTCSIGPELVTDPDFDLVRARWPSSATARDLDQGDRHRRWRHVPQPRQPRAPPFQVRVRIGVPATSTSTSTAPTA